MRNVARLKVVPRDQLDDLARETVKRWESLRAHVRLALEDALALGVLLNEAKTQLRHGEWGAWLKRCGDIPLRTAQLYMQLTRADLPAEVKTIRQAREVIQQSRQNSYTSESAIDIATAESTEAVCVGCDARLAMPNRKICSGCQAERYRAIQARMLRWFEAERWGYCAVRSRTHKPIPIMMRDEACLIWPHSPWSPPLVLDGSADVTDTVTSAPNTSAQEPPAHRRGRLVTAVLVLGKVEMVNGILPDVTNLIADAASNPSNIAFLWHLPRVPPLPLLE